LPETFKAIYMLNQSGLSLDKVDFTFVKGYDCARARNEICKKAIEGNYDYVLMVDSDIVLPEDTLQCLFDPKFEEDKTELVLGIYPKKNCADGKTDIFSFNTENYGDANRYHISEFRQLAKHGVYRIAVKGGGFGCALIKTSVLKILPAPWFLYVTYPNGHVLSEDLFFCSRLEDHDYRVSVDTRVRCGHLIRKFQYE